MLPKNWIITAVLLAFGLAGVIYIQTEIAGKIQKKPQPSITLGDSIQWCDGNITGLSIPGQFQLRSIDGNWFHGEKKIQGINLWVKNNCPLKLDHVQNSGAAKMLNPLFIIEFDNGKLMKSFQVDPTGRYAWQGHLFVSAQFNNMLKELRTLIRK